MLHFLTRKFFFQLKDVASVVLASEKFTSPAELFSIELKFIIDTLNDCHKTYVFGAK